MSVYVNASKTIKICESLPEKKPRVFHRLQCNFNEVCIRVLFKSKILFSM